MQMSLDRLAVEPIHGEIDFKTNRWDFPNRITVIYRRVNFQRPANFYLSLCARDENEILVRACIKYAFRVCV